MQGRFCVPISQYNLVKVWKTIPVLCTLFLSILVFVCCFCVKETISSLPLIVRYLTEGKSFFLPFLPKVSLFGFLPAGAQVLPLTINHVLDFIIFVNLLTVGNPIAIPFYKKVCQEYQQGQFYDLRIGCQRSRQSSTWFLIDTTPTILLNNHGKLDVVEEAVEDRDFARAQVNENRAAFVVARGERGGGTEALPGTKRRGHNKHVQASTTKSSPPFSSMHNQAGFPSRSSNATRSRIVPMIFSLAFLSKIPFLMMHQ